MGTVYRSLCGCIASAPEPDWSDRLPCCDRYPGVSLDDNVVTDYAAHNEHDQVHADAFEAVWDVWNCEWIAQNAKHAAVCPKRGRLDQRDPGDETETTGRLEWACCNICMGDAPAVRGGRYRACGCVATASPEPTPRSAVDNLVRDGDEWAARQTATDDPALIPFREPPALPMSHEELAAATRRMADATDRRLLAEWDAAERAMTERLDAAAERPTMADDDYPDIEAPDLPVIPDDPADDSRLGPEDFEAIKWFEWENYHADRKAMGGY